ncbi:MAG: Asp/Glu racemase [Acidimicrobiia bacterium]|nr:Asp/Glu racemase [Acidimicrobiia bacterium]
MSRTIVVINPNSSEKITKQIQAAVQTVDADAIAVTSRAGPPAIESDDDVTAAVAPMIATADRHSAAAYVVACFSDPGLDDLRAHSTTPAFGIAESAIRVASETGSKVGVISSVAASLPRHERYWQKIGATELIAADIPLGLGVLELDTPQAFERALAAGRLLIEAGADVIVLGCTGMTHMESRLEGALGVPVVDPCRAAIELARRTIEELM